MRSWREKFLPTVASFWAISQRMNWLVLPICLYWLCRRVASLQNWELREKSSRQHFEDIFFLLLLSLLLNFFCTFDAVEDPGNGLGSSALTSVSSSGSEEDTGTGGVHAPLHKAQPKARPALLPPGHASSSSLSSSSASCLQCLRMQARVLLSGAGVLAFFIAALVMGALGGDFPASLDSKNMWRPPTVLVVGPMLALIALCIVYCGVLSIRAGGDALLLWCGALILALCFFFIALAISAGPSAPGSKGCERLLFHPHHYQLCFFSTLLLRRHWLSPGSSLLHSAPAFLAFLTKCALAGILVQGLAQYGADSILRTTTCAKS
jgi:hypothetical protein